MKRSALNLLLIALIVMLGCATGCRGIRLPILAHLGSVEAMYELGQAYCTTSGQGIVTPSNKEGSYWFREAARKGHTPSMYVLSQVGDASSEERVMWLKKGAEMGNKGCMVELMNGHQTGAFGLPSDVGAFLFWEARLSEVLRKENGKLPAEIATELGKDEIRRRRELNYDGPIRPL